MVYYGLGLDDKICVKICCIIYALQIILHPSLGLNAGSLAGNIFMNNILNAVLEIVGRCLIPFLMEWKVFGRKRSLALCFLLLGISCLR